MVKRKQKNVAKREVDSVFVLKLALYLIVGSLWLRITDIAGTSQVPIPVGLLMGLVFAAHEHFRIDKKIEYALLLNAAFIGFWLPMGISWVR